MKLMLDSGAFSAWNKGGKIDIDAYIEFVKTYGHLFETCINLDVIGNGQKSYENWLYLRKNGVDTTPVYHMGTDEDFLKKYIAQTDYVGIGAIANASWKTRMVGLTDLWNKYIYGKDGRPKLKTHAMGLTATDFIVKFPWYSVDSISPILQAGFGGVYLPKIERGLAFNFLKLGSYKTSQQSKAHQSTILTSYFTLPMLLREKYEELFEKYKFKIGSIEKPLDTFFFKEKPKKETEEESFVTSYKHRVRWNLLMWEEMNKLIPGWDGTGHLEIFVGSASHYKYVSETEKLGQLFTYYEINKEHHIENIVKRYLKT